MEINVLEMPLDLGASRHGSDMGPSAIRLAGLKEKNHRTWTQNNQIFLSYGTTSPRIRRCRKSKS